jgi:HK97 family phage prohead protease
MAELTRRTFQTELRVEQEEGKPATVTGLAVPYNALSVDLGGFREMFVPGAFKRTIRDKDEIFIDVEHDRTKKLARTSTKTARLIDSDEGLSVRFTVPDTTLGRDTLEEIRSGLIDGMSIAFSEAEDEWTGLTDNVIRSVKRAKLHAVTLTSYPAFQQTAGTVAERAFAEYRSTQETPPAEPPAEPTKTSEAEINRRRAEIELAEI